MKFATSLSALAAGLVLAQPALAFDYQHVRNATAKISYGGSTFLVDPYLAAKGIYPGFEGTLNSQLRNPLIDMSVPADELLKGVDAVIVTHTHDDHWDKAAQELLPKNLPIFVQNPGDAKTIRAQGFTDVRVMGRNTPFGKVRLSKTGGQHGTDQMYSMPQLAERLGDAMGVVMQADSEKTLYIVGDTLWNSHVETALQQYKPQVVVMNTGYARIEGLEGGIIMGTPDVKRMVQAVSKAQVITVHMDAVNHATVSSEQMRDFVKKQKLDKQVFVPKTGEVLKF
ncbi:MAG: MBL fold metallo-hydrolase [Lautropia sp.]|nr:MBL fold metallo-hydrolase [Lautropia sp.]